MSLSQLMAPGGISGGNDPLVAGRWGENKPCSIANGSEAGAAPAVSADARLLFACCCLHVGREKAPSVPLAMTGCGE